MTTPTTGAVARFEEAAKEMRAVQTVEDAILWNRKWGNIHGFIGVARDALAEQAAEIDRLKADVNSLNNVLRAAGWGQGEIDYSASVLEKMENQLTDARAAGVREGLEQAYKWFCENLDLEHNQKLFRTEFNLDGKGRHET